MIKLHTFYFGSFAGELITNFIKQIIRVVIGNIEKISMPKIPRFDPNEDKYKDIYNEIHWNSLKQTLSDYKYWILDSVIIIGLVFVTYIYWDSIVGHWRIRDGENGPGFMEQDFQPNIHLRSC